MQTLDADFIRDQANLSREVARRNNERQVRQLSVSMPLHFASKRDYICKLTELLFIESEVERLNTEMIAEKDI